MNIQFSLKPPGNVKINNACQKRKANIMGSGVNMLALFLALVQYFSSLCQSIFFFYRKQSLFHWWDEFLIFFFYYKQNSAIKKTPFLWVLFKKKKFNLKKEIEALMLNVSPLTCHQNLRFVFKGGILLCSTVFMTKEYICFLCHCCGVITCKWLKQMESSLSSHTYLWAQMRHKTIGL